MKIVKRAIQIKRELRIVRDPDRPGWAMSDVIWSFDMILNGNYFIFLIRFNGSRLFLATAIPSYATGILLLY